MTNLCGCSIGVVVLIVSVYCCFYGCQACLEEERTALLQLKDDINYANNASYFVTGDWVGDDCCQWKALEAWYPNATLFAQFKELELLDLAWNQIGGWVMPEGFTQMQNLEILKLGLNRLNESSNSLWSLCGLTKLRSLDLDYHNLDDGALPPCLLSTSSPLEELFLYGNNLRGNLPGLCGLKRLKELDLGNNFLNDQSLPSCLLNLSSLELLDLSENNFSNPFGIPTGLCKLSNLVTLNLKRNSIEGNIHPCLKDMHYLQSLDLSYNCFSGGVPSFVFNNLTMMETIFLSNNQFTGVFSFSMFANLSKLSYVDLSNNVQLEVETEYPHWVPTFQIMWLLLENCNLNQRSTSSIPSFISNQQRLYSFQLDHNSLKGVIPSWLLYNTTSLRIMSLRGNHFEGSIP
ncbi:receptor-like protein 9b isoform X2 [Tasmannia lanceolata]|uniref:receptor-like protein 9b isoform X2 n=1 Tax=Tasmannia lanceolata TaxID=3420 RepID=UPI0040632A0C